MKKTKKYFIIILAFVVVFAAGIAVLKLTEPETTDDTSSTVSTTSIPLVEKTLKDITKLTVDNAKGYTLVLNSVYDEETSTVDVTVEGINEKIDLVKQTTQGLLTYGYKLSASKDIGVQEDLDQYGLKTPAAKVTAEFTDGSKFVYSIGTSNPNGGYYAKVEGKDEVYVINIADTIFSKPTDLVTLELTTIPTTSADGETEAAATCHNLVIGGKNHEQEIVIKLAEEAQVHSSHLMTQPTRGTDYYCDSDYINNIILSVSNINALSAANLEPTQEDLESYGLSEPAATLEFEVAYNAGEEEDDEYEVGDEIRETHKLYIGNIQDDGSYPLMIDDNPVVFFVSKSVVSRWYDVEPYTLRSTFILLPNITKVSEVEVSYNGEEHVFEKPRTYREQPSANSSLLYDYTVKNTAGEEITYTTFQKYYRALMSVSLLEDTTLDPVGEALFTIKYYYYDSEDVDEISYYEMPDNSRQYIVKVNGSVYGVVRKTDVDELYQATADIENDICELI